MKLKAIKAPKRHDRKLIAKLLSKVNVYNDKQTYLEINPISADLCAQSFGFYGWND